MKTIKYYIHFFIILLISVSDRGIANNDHESESLYRLLHEVRYLNSIIEEAKQSANDDGVLRFDYKVLEKELTAIEKGISDYLHRERRDPRSLETIHGVFTHGD